MEEGGPQADSRSLHCLTALPPGGSLALTRVQGDCQELSMGCAEVETLGEEMWGVEGCLGDAGLRSEETSGLEVYMAEYQRPRACGHGCGRAWVEP